MLLEISAFLSVVFYFGIAYDSILDDEAEREFDIIDRDAISIDKYNEKISIAKYIECDNFRGYAARCRSDAALIYNSSRMSPPAPLKINDWCKAIKLLVKCATLWDASCADVTSRRFNAETVKGHAHVAYSICDNEVFVTQYKESLACIENSTSAWESCYATFDNVLEEQKNNSLEWTHYEVHFVLCCARARFRRCTLNLLFSSPHCTQEQAVVLQRFSAIVSEGAVYQDCDRNMMYENCPGGDPRPSERMLLRLTNGIPDATSKTN
ncbi:uncharacterized protein LOC121728088 [Aricia agestis]|uniref:uncharacterized protein LOC121728088 n=1 Tax=Aricia agestis TaxID=91739 RepID=UPI001C202913|nr:uncharacterized protein LOC121728088 [Aricia agestis]